MAPIQRGADGGATVREIDSIRCGGATRDLLNACAANVTELPEDCGPDHDRGHAGAEDVFGRRETVLPVESIEDAEAIITVCQYAADYLGPKHHAIKSAIARVLEEAKDARDALRAAAEDPFAGNDPEDRIGGYCPACGRVTTHVDGECVHSHDDGQGRLMTDGGEPTDVETGIENQVVVTKRTRRVDSSGDVALRSELGRDLADQLPDLGFSVHVEPRTGGRPIRWVVHDPNRFGDRGRWTGGMIAGLVDETDGFAAVGHDHNSDTAWCKVDLEQTVKTINGGGD